MKNIVYEVQSNFNSVVAPKLSLSGSLVDNWIRKSFNPFVVSHTGITDRIIIEFGFYNKVQSNDTDVISSKII